MYNTLHRQAFSTTAALIDTFADFAADALTHALEKQHSVSLVVPGGSTPRAYLPALASRSLPWRRIAITLSDERWVDTDTADSNEQLVAQCLLHRLPEKPFFTGLKTPHATPDAAVATVEQRLKVMPQPFTLSVLGLGEDGHIASLFPGLKLHEKPCTPHLAIRRLCLAVPPSIAPVPRISLSLDALADSEQIAIVVTGKAKRQLLDTIERQPNPAIPLVWLLQRVNKPVAVFESD